MPLVAEFAGRRSAVVAVVGWFGLRSVVAVGFVGFVAGLVERPIERASSSRRCWSIAS